MRTAKGGNKQTVTFGAQHLCVLDKLVDAPAATHARKRRGRGNIWTVNVRREPTYAIQIQALADPSLYLLPHGSHGSR